MFKIISKDENGPKLAQTRNIRLKGQLAKKTILDKSSELKLTQLQQSISLLLR